MTEWMAIEQPSIALFGVFSAFRQCAFVSAETVGILSWWHSDQQAFPLCEGSICYRSGLHFREMKIKLYLMDLISLQNDFGISLHLQVFPCCFSHVSSCSHDQSIYINCWVMKGCQLECFLKQCLCKIYIYIFFFYNQLKSNEVKLKSTSDELVEDEK